MCRARLPLMGLLALLVVACEPPPLPPDVTEPPPDGLLTLLDSVTVRTHLEQLSADVMEGRAPGTRGEERAVAYIAEQMEAAGLAPGAPEGGFFQRVPLLGVTPRPQSTLLLTHEDGSTLDFTFVDDFIASTDLDAERVETEGEIVFVGYGIDAPEYDWDDYGDVDVRGKILLMFVNDPIAGADEPDLFQGETLTYYGRWTYKYEEARRRGAKGVLLIHTIPTAGYPFTVLSGTAASEQIQLAEPPENPLELKGWITQPAARQLADLAGTTLDDLFAAANSRAFQPRPLPVRAALDVAYRVRRFEGTNVLGKLEGTVRPGEALVYTAHHDHLGYGRPVGGDSLYNGAVDNATGVAMLLALAEAHAAQDPAPGRTLLFVSLTAEESGLLGAEFYTRNPALPLRQTVANINVDSGNIHGPTDDIVGIGAERSELEAFLADAAEAEGLTVSPDPQPNQGIFFRSDQLAFARAGVPAVYLTSGRRFRGQPDDYYSRVAADYNRLHYHQPSDEFDPSWPMEGLLQQARVAFRIGYRLANGARTPRWHEAAGFARP